MKQLSASSDRTLGVERALSPLRRLAGLVVLACMAVLAGCAVTPEARRSLDGYVLAMGQVEKSANTFLTDFADGLQAQSDLERGAGTGRSTAGAEYPTSFDPKLPVNATDDAIARTRQSLDVVRQYNGALVALAEGRTEPEFRAQAMAFGGALEGLVSIAGASIPGLGAFVALGPKIIKLADDAANREQLVQAVKAGREPVGLILSALEEQTASLYRLSVVSTRQGQDKLQTDIRRAADVLKKLLAANGPPQSAEIGAKVVTLEGQLQAIGNQTKTLGAMPIPFAFSPGKPAYDAVAHAQADLFVQAMRAAADRYAELVARQNAYHALLKKYVAALRQSARALELLEASLARPVDLRAEANRLLNVAFELRDAMASYRGQPASAAAP